MLHYYRMMVSLSRGDAIFKYLEIIQTLPMYSMHYFDVKVRAERERERGREGEREGEGGRGREREGERGRGREREREGGREREREEDRVS